jgi:hypothetical protein
MLRTRALVVGLAGALVLAVSPTLAATIVGSGRADTLRGTPRADRLYGKGGKDTLVGRGGNDLLVGGAGADRLLCGPGRDVARADSSDKVGRDCEVVKGLVPSLPTTSGTYCGVTSQDMSICLDVEVSGLGVQIVSGIRLTVQTSCDPPRQAAFNYKLMTRAALQRDRAFGSSVSFAGLSAVVEGSFEASKTSASGTLRVRAQENRSGVMYECDSGDVAWAAETPPPSPSAQTGRYRGRTDQGLEIGFEIVGAPKTVTNLELRVRTACAPPGPVGVLSTIPTAYAVRADNTFAITRTGTGTTAGGVAYTITHRLRGASDSGGTAVTGTLEARVVYQTADGVGFECDSGTIAWSAMRQ